MSKILLPYPVPPSYFPNENKNHSNYDEAHNQKMGEECCISGNYQERIRIHAAAD